MALTLLSQFFFRLQSKRLWSAVSQRSLQKKYLLPAQQLRVGRLVIACWDQLKYEADSELWLLDFCWFVFQTLLQITKQRISSNRFFFYFPGWNFQKYEIRRKRLILHTFPEYVIDKHVLLYTTCNESKSISYHSEKTTLNMNQLYLAWPNSCFYKHNSQCSHERGVSTEINPFLLLVGEERSCVAALLISDHIMWTLNTGDSTSKKKSLALVLAPQSMWIANFHLKQKKNNFIPDKAKFPKKICIKCFKSRISKKKLPVTTIQWRGSLVAVSGSGLSPVPGCGSQGWEISAAR